MPSASNSCAREKLASAIFDFASAIAPSLRIVEHVGGDAADQRGLAHLVLADRGVARDHVRHLVRQHRGELGGVVGEREQPARDVELAVRQREGVDRRRVEDGRPCISGPAARTPRPACRRSASSSASSAGSHRRRHRPRGCARARAAPAARAVGGLRVRAGRPTWLVAGMLAAEQPASITRSGPALRGSDQAAFERHDVAAVHRHARVSVMARDLAISICSGRAASIQGPPRSSIIPRTRTVLAGKLFNSAYRRP